MVSGRDVCTTSAPWLENSDPAFFLRLALLIAGAEGGWPNRCRHANSDWSRKRTATRICMYACIYIRRYVCIKASEKIIMCNGIHVCMYVCTRVSGPVHPLGALFEQLAQLLRAGVVFGLCGLPDTYIHTYMWTYIDNRIQTYMITYTLPIHTYILSYTHRKSKYKATRHPYGRIVLVWNVYGLPVGGRGWRSSIRRCSPAFQMWSGRWTRSETFSATTASSRKKITL